MKLIAHLGGVMFVIHLAAADPTLRTPVESIALPEVRGRIDHFALDAKGRRLFVAALGNDTVEVIDLASRKQVRSLAGCSSPQGLCFAPGANRLFVANGGNGTVRVLDGETFGILKIIDELPDADNVRLDPVAGLIYVGYGDGGLAIIEATNANLVARIPLAGHPESFQLERHGARIFVNVPDARQVAVVDRDQRAVTATWPMREVQANFPMALDESNHRLFIGCRRPARLVVLDTTNGRVVTDREIPGDTDDLFYDARRKLIYISCGKGVVDVVEQISAEEYRSRKRVATRAGARTSFFAVDLDAYFVAVPKRGQQEAEVRVLRPADFSN